MTILAFIAGLLVGGFTVGWATRKQIREVQAEALWLLSAREGSTIEGAARRVEI